ncbi:hypothetical protein ElyMa_001901800 [Elysia marginata]|uniref:Uncharacterized protein n=1 Tax=Elysia marginata TaxID=1093978 RepID=A0AAV4EU53_9GAST|nr:hypothetical protein ElyMa_001901800 [Elysia marginata]
MEKSERETEKQCERERKKINVFSSSPHQGNCQDLAEVKVEIKSCVAHNSGNNRGKHNTGNSGFKGSSIIARCQGLTFELHSARAQPSTSYHSIDSRL